MHGVTTAIIGFIFVCIIWPHLVKNRPQFYAALGALIAIILLDSLARMINSVGFGVFAYVFTGLLQVGAILLLILSAGGVSPRELFSDMGRAIEVIRRGEEEKEIIIPRSDQPRPVPGTPRDTDEEERVVWNITDDDVKPAPQAPPPKKDDDRGPLSLD